MLWTSEDEGCVWIGPTQSCKLKTPWDEEIHKRTANVSREAEHLKEAANFTFKPVGWIQVQVPLSENLRYQWMNGWRRQTQEAKARQRLTSTNINSSSRFISSPESGSPASHAARPPPFWEPPARAQRQAALKLIEHWEPQVPGGIKPSHCVLRHSQSFSVKVCLGFLAMWQATGRSRCLSNYGASFLHHMSKKKQKNRIFPQQQNKFVFYRCTVKHNLIPMNV